MREVFDRIGVERRAAGDLDLTTVEPIALTDIGEGEPGYLPLMSLTRIVVAGHEIPGAYFVQDYTIADAEADLALPIYGYHYTRGGLVLDRLVELGHRLYPDAPNVSAMVLEPRLGNDQAVQGDATIDLIHRSLAAMPTSGGAGSAHPLLVGGVIGHAAERAVVEGGARRAAEFGQQISVQSVDAIFDAARRENLALRVLLPGAGKGPPSGISPVAAERIAGALADGYAVVVPERAVTVGERAMVGWWQIDPATGETFDVLEDGRGAARFVATGEDSVPRVVVVVRNAPVYKKMSLCVFFISMGAGMVLGGIGAIAGGAYAGGPGGDALVGLGAGGALGGAATSAAGIACAVA
jgi:hypothetical protein